MRHIQRPQFLAHAGEMTWIFHFLHIFLLHLRIFAPFTAQKQSFVCAVDVFMLFVHGFFPVHISFRTVLQPVSCGTQSPRQIDVCQHVKSLVKTAYAFHSLAVYHYCTG